MAAHDVKELQGTVGWRVRAANGVPIDELMARYDAYPRERTGWTTSSRHAAAHFPVTLEVFRRFDGDLEAPLRDALELVANGKIAPR